MNEGLIMLVGPIGSFEYEGGTVQGVELLDVVAAVTKLGPEINTIRVQYDTPGGRKDVGKNIYNYLMSLKPKYKIISEQIGMVGSIGSVIWFSGDDRIATEGEEFFVHNPWIPSLSGDGDYVLQIGADLKATEAELMQFYVSQTGIPKEGWAPLMQAETTFGAERALELKFATSIQKASKIAAYMNTDKAFGEKLEAILNLLKGKKPVVNLVVELEGEAGKISIDAPDSSKLEGAPVFMVDESGNPTQVPAADKEYMLKGMGKKITVTGGKVAKVDVVPNPATPPATPPPVDQAAVNAKMDELLELLKSSVVTKKDLDEALALKVTEIKSGIQSTHVPPVKKSLTNTEDAKKWDEAFKANKITAMKRDTPEEYKRLFMAKYGKLPNM